MVTVRGIAVLGVVAVLTEELGRCLPKSILAGSLVFGVWDVSGVERDVCEEGLVGLGTAANEVAGGVSGEIGAVALGLDGLGPAVKIVTVVVAVGVVVAVSRDVTEEFVEAMLNSFHQQ